MYRNYKLKNSFFINPFFAYTLCWLVTIFLYAISPSRLNLPLDNNLVFFIVVTCIISLFFGLFFEIHFKNKEIKIYRHNIPNWLLIIMAFLYLAEFAYSRQIPLLSSLIGKNAADYKDFGIPTVHVIIATFSSFFAIYTGFLFYLFRDRKYLFSFLLSFSYFLLIFSRGIIIFIIACLILLIMSISKIRLRTIILLLVVAIFGSWVFGILGNIRSGYEWNDSYIIINYAKIKADRFNLLSPFYWTEEYIICSLRNLNYNIVLGNSSHSLVDFFASIVPDFISKRIFDSNINILLLHPAFTTGTAYAQSYVTMGFGGMYLNFAIYMIVALFISLCHLRKKELNMILLSITFFLFFMSIFDNMLPYSGYSFALIYPFIFNFIGRTKKRKKVHNAKN